METYICISTIVLLFSLLVDKNYSNKITLNTFNYNVIVLIFILFSGLRWNVGTDYMQYYRNYELYKAFNFNDIFFIFEEPGIRIIAKISSYIYDDPLTMLFICGIIINYLFVRTIFENTNNFTLSIAVFMFSGIWLGSFNGIRQYLAASVVVYAFKYIKKREFFKFFIAIFTASLFHISAWFCLIFYFIYEKRFKIKQIIYYFLLALAVSFANTTIVNKLGNILNFNNILITYSMRDVNKLRILFNFIPVFLYYFLTVEKNRKKENAFYSNILVLNFILSVAFMRNVYFSRLLIYINSFMPIALPVIHKDRKQENKIFISTILILLYYIFWAYEVHKSSSLIPYTTIFTY